MLNEGLLTLHEGYLAASANYAGYLVGALLLARVQPGAATRLSIISAGLTIASLALLAWVSSPWTIISLRAVAGALSAITKSTIQQEVFLQTGLIYLLTMK
ncbi:YbfB/YjiJ family MFS transporter [Klebsiella pneumoniae]